MVRKPPPRSAVIVIVGLAVAFGVWTWLVFSRPPLQAIDRRIVPPPVDPRSAVGEILAAFALLTWPGLIYAALLGIAFWAGRHRLRQLSTALVLTVVLGWGGATALKLILRRPRPAQALDLITAHGYAYPSGHVVAVVAGVIAVGATLAVTRQSARARLVWQVAAAAIVLAVALDRWLLSAHYISDLIGGALFGALVASFSLAVAGVSVPIPHEIVTELVRKKPPVDLEGAPPKRCAVVYNPAKVTDWAGFRRHVEYELSARGWQRTLWLETTPEDPGVEMTARAVEEQVDLVLGAGGDGTIRVICSGLANTGIPFGLIPAGTGNLLARNIGIPLDEAAALDVAFDGVDKPIDLVKLTIDDETTHHFAVMAGIGIDAVIMQGTNPDLKKAVGSAAYFVSAARNANHPPLHATIRVDGQPPLRRRAHVIVIGNVGYLQANIPLIPDAKPDDGLLDVLIASPRGMADWVKLTTRVLTRGRRTDAQLDRLTGRSVRITVEERDHYQLDGDTAGQCNSMTAEVQQGALTLRVPRSWRREPGTDELSEETGPDLASTPGSVGVRA
jgi:diacylglycerol kinase family enzyme/membrane-associated phospholipid phosphatase